MFESVPRPASGGAPLPAFDFVMRGYHRAQVDAYVHGYVAELEREVTELRFRVPPEPVDGVETEAQRLIRDRRALEKERSEWHPSFSVLGQHAERILALAEESGRELREHAERETAQLRERTHRECVDLRRRAQAAAESEQKKADAVLEASNSRSEATHRQLQDDVAERRAQAQAQAAAIVDRARAESAEVRDRTDGEIESARAEADQELAKLRRQRDDLVAELAMVAERLRPLVGDRIDITENSDTSRTA